MSGSICPDTVKNTCKTALVCILEKYIGICGNDLKLIKSYFYNHTQRVQMYNVLTDLANIICVLRPLKFVFIYCL